MPRPKRGGVVEEIVKSIQAPTKSCVVLKPTLEKHPGEFTRRIVCKGGLFEVGKTDFGNMGIGKAVALEIAPLMMLSALQSTRRLEELLD